MKSKFSPLLWLFIAIFFVRALLPTGFMPDFSGKHIMTICSGMSMATILVDENNQPVPTPPHHTFADICPFSSLATAFLTNTSAGIPLTFAPDITSDGMPAFFLAGILPLSLQNNHLSRAPPEFS